MVNMTPSRSDIGGAAHPKWMTRELVAETIRVWSATLRREVTEPEAVEMLMSVRRLSACAIRSKREVKNEG